MIPLGAYSCVEGKMKPAAAILEYFKLGQELKVARALNMIEDEEAGKGVITKGEIQKSVRIHEPQKLLRFSTLGLRLKRAKDENPDAVSVFTVAVLTSMSIRQMTRRINSRSLQKVGRKRVTALLHEGRAIVQKHVEDL